MSFYFNRLAFINLSQIGEAVMSYLTNGGPEVPLLP
jgi:hypothetical protein